MEKKRREEKKKLRKWKDKKKGKGKKDAVTNSKGKFGIIRKIDMWYVATFSLSCEIVLLALLVVLFSFLQELYLSA